VSLALSLGTAPGCSKKQAEEDRSLPTFTFKDDAPDLMLTWIDDKGDTHVAMKPSEVPTEGRGLVRVVVSDREDGTHDLFYVSDLGLKREDGTYPTRTLPRRDWENEIEKRREAFLERTSPHPAASGSNAATGAPTVIIYGASWCGPCHQAADYLKSKGVRYVMKDVEETPGAQSEMQQKLARIGRRGGSIPVIDVGGQILIGFSPSSVDQALAAASKAL
jgi:glutaredoxin